MQQEEWIIHLDKLRQLEEFEWDGEIDISKFDINDENLRFFQPVQAHLNAYIVEKQLIIRFSAKTVCQIRCSVCNQWYDEKIEVPEQYLTLELDEIKEDFYDCWPNFREELLVMAPLFGECHHGKCPERKHIKAYLREKNQDQADTKTFKPFENLKWSVNENGDSNIELG